MFVCYFVLEVVATRKGGISTHGNDGSASYSSSVRWASVLSSYANGSVVFARMCAFL